MTTVPTTVIDDTQVSISDGGGVPWWLFFLAILLALLLGGAVMLALNNRGPIASEGSFTDDQGNEWKYCAARACRVKLRTVTRTPSEGGRQVQVSAQPRGNGCTGGNCKCVLFENPAGGGRPIFARPERWLGADGGRQGVLGPVRRIGLSSGG